MDFGFDPELESIRHEARRLADKFDDDYWRDHDEKHEFPWEFYNAFAEQGWMGIIIPEKYGGSGLGVMAGRSVARTRPVTARAYRMRPRRCTSRSLGWVP